MGRLFTESHNDEAVTFLISLLFFHAKQFYLFYFKLFLQISNNSLKFREMHLFAFFEGYKDWKIDATLVCILNMKLQLRDG